MEQSIIDTSRFKIHSVSIDSRFAATNYSGTSDFLIRLPSPFKNIMRIRLSSVELPQVEWLFSDPHGNINFSIKIGAAPWQSLVIPQGNYSPDSLIAAINIALISVEPNLVCSKDPISNIITFTHTIVGTYFLVNLTSDNADISRRPTHWGIGYYLGIRQKGNIAAISSLSGIYSLSGASIITTEPTPYYLLQVETPDTVETLQHCLATYNSIPAFAKLVLRNGYYVIQYIDNADFIRKEYTYLSPSNISVIRVRLLDPYGSLVDMKSMDWSLTFEFSEVVNSRVAGFLHENFSR